MEIFKIYPDLSYNIIIIKTNVILCYCKCVNIRLISTNMKSTKENSTKTDRLLGSE